MPECESGGDGCGGLDGHGEGSHSAELVILFPFVVLVVGAASEVAVSGTAIPYTTFLLIIGCLMGFLMRVRPRRISTGRLRCVLIAFSWIFMRV